MELAFRGAAGQPCSIPAAELAFLDAAKQPCSILPSPVPGILLGQGGLAAPSIPSASPRAGCMIMDSPMALLPPTCDLWAAAQDVGLSLSQTRQESGVLLPRSRLCAGCGGNGVASLNVSALHLGMEQ